DRGVSRPRSTGSRQARAVTGNTNAEEERRDMKQIILALAVTMTATSAFAQNPVSDSLRSSWNGVKRNIKESAELMPEENYTFKPTADVRSFGEILAHV